MARPYNLYVRFLVTTGCTELKEVNTHLEELGLHWIDKPEFDQCYDFVHKKLPEPVSRQIIDKRYEGDFLRWMKVLEVDGMWQLEKPYRNQENVHLKLAREINYDPQLRLVINALIIKGVKLEDLPQTINLKFSAMLKLEHFILYSRFFCDPRRMTRREWRSYLRGCNERERSVYFLALTENLEDLKTHLDLPSTANISNALQYLFTSSYQKAKQYLRLNTPDSNKEARNWISQTLALADKYEKHRTGDVEDFGKSLQLEFDYLDMEFQSPDENSIAELKEKQKKMDDEASNV